jgi:hypothetical protein
MAPATSLASGHLDVAVIRISRAANSSLRKNTARRPSQASVASAAMVGRTPLKLPKFDSMPQIAAMIAGGTP